MSVTQARTSNILILDVLITRIAKITVQREVLMIKHSCKKVSFEVLSNIIDSPIAPVAHSCSNYLAIN